MGLASCESPLKHLGMIETPSKSTLAYANAKRPWQLYETVFNQLLGKCQAEVVTEGNRSELEVARSLHLEAGTILASIAATTITSGSLR
jgi:hypothetical protein